MQKANFLSEYNGWKTVAQPGFVQGGGQSFLSNTAQVQWQNPQNLVAKGISRILFPEDGVCAVFKQNVKKFVAIAHKKILHLRNCTLRIY